MATSIKTVQQVPISEPMASIDTRNQSRLAQVGQFSGGGNALGGVDDPFDAGDGGADGDIPASLIKLYRIAESAGDNICDLLEPGQVERLGTDAVREWRIDEGSRAQWKDDAEEFLSIAAQDDDGYDDRDGPWGEGAPSADIHYPILTSAALQFNARAAPELIKGDKVVGVKVFTPPPMHPNPVSDAKAGPQPQNDQQAQQATQAIQQQQQTDAEQDAQMKARMARGERVKHYMNWCVFYRMDDWEGDSDLLLMQAPIIGSGFKKVYMSPEGLQSDFVTALRLTVHNDTKSLDRCPRMTQDFEVYPYEIDERIANKTYRDITLDPVGSDPQSTRKLIEQYRMDDLDGDGFAEPYIVTVDVDTMQTLRVEPAFCSDDIIINNATGELKRIDRWNPFAAFLFLPDVRGRFYGMGLGKLLQSITDSVDTTVNQLIDAGNAEIAGGGFIASGVRLQGAGQSGSIYRRPGEWQSITASGQDLRASIWESTIPSPSPVALQLLELLLASAKDIASVKDVITGDAPSTAPVGTTMALQQQALQVFSSIYKRIYRGFKDEFRLMYRCLKRWPSDKIRAEYKELTGGDFDEDFTGDGTDIQPVADPTVVTKMQKIARIQTLMQLAESPVGMAAGMTQAAPAQEIMGEALEALDYDRIERFMAQVQPNPELVAKTADLNADAQLKSAQAQALGSKGTLDQAKALRETGLAAKDTHELHEKADWMNQSGSGQPAPEGGAHTHAIEQREAELQRRHEAETASRQQAHERDLAEQQAESAPAA